MDCSIFHIHQVLQLQMHKIQNDLNLPDTKKQHYIIVITTLANYQNINIKLQHVLIKISGNQTMSCSIYTLPVLHKMHSYYSLSHQISVISMYNQLSTEQTVYIQTNMFICAKWFNQEKLSNREKL